jgi:uncharacterized protein (DUF885 family)
VTQSATSIGTRRSAQSAKETRSTVAAASIRALADELTEVLLRADPFWASFMAISGYDDAVPDLSPEGQQAWRDRLVDIIVRSGPCEADPAKADTAKADTAKADTAKAEDRILLEAVRDTAARYLAAADSRIEEYSVTTFPLSGPSRMLLIASRTRVHDPDSAAAYLARCRSIPAHLDQGTEMLRTAADNGLLPVAPLVDNAVRQLRDHLSHPARDPLLSHEGPGGWAGTPSWRDEIERIVRDGIRPAIGRYADLLAELLPRSRPPERAGLLHVPGGVAAYACCIRNGTTLPLDPDELHHIGLAALAEIEERIADLGIHAMGTSDINDIMTRLRHDATQDTQGAPAMARAAVAVSRAQDRLAEIIRPPMPPLCTVEPMPPHMAEFGSPPYYSPPAPDGSRPGAYLFNHIHPGQAGQWALEATAFHEAIPGHHVQFARLQLMSHLPRLLTAFYVVPHGEGWGLYAERLADEFGLYSDDTQRLGMLGCAAWRAVRLVVDSGLHARGWSREQARAFAYAHSPMPPGFVDAEIDRYIAVPGQALGYLIGQREIRRLRDDARSRLGAAFDLRDFHSAVLDHGSVPLRVLGRIVADWVSERDPPGQHVGPVLGAAS